MKTKKDAMEIYKRPVLKGKRQTKPYTLPSGKIVSIQGYEDLALDELFLVHKINEEDILLESEAPVIQYINSGGLTRNYFPDIYIKSKHLIIEVKSPYTMRYDFDNNLSKKKYCVLSGYNFQFWIYKNRKTLIHEEFV